MSALDLPESPTHATEGAERSLCPAALDAAAPSEHEARVEEAWHDFAVAAEISELNLCGRARLDARGAYNAAAALWHAASALGRSDAGRAVLELAEANISAIGSLAAELRSLNDRAASNPYSRLRGSASFVPLPGVLRPREPVYPVMAELTAP